MYANGVDSEFSPDSEHKYKLRNDSPFSGTLTYDRRLYLRHYSSAVPPVVTAIGSVVTNNISWSSNSGQEDIYTASGVGMGTTIYNPPVGTYTASAYTEISNSSATVAVEHYHSWTRQ